KFSLLDFPILQCWPQDAGRFITLPCVVTRDPNSGKRNVGMYRLQVYDATTTGAHWQRQKVAAEHYRQALRNSGRTADTTTKESAPLLPSFGRTGNSAAVDLMARTSGGQVLAEANHPSGKMEVAVAIGTDPAVTFSAIVPATSEMVLEGYVNLDELRTEGPFGDHTGFYSLADLYPVFHVQCITHRKD